LGFSKNALLDPYNPRWLRFAILKIDMTSFLSAEGGPIWIKFRRLVQNDMSTALMCRNRNNMVDVRANSMVCHPRAIIPEPHIILQGAAIGEFTVTIPEPHATLQGALTWRNQCHDRATLQGVRIPSAIFKIVFLLYFILFLFLMQFRLRRAAAFVSSPIHLFGKQLMTMTLCYNNRPPTLSLIPVIYNSLGQNKSKELESRRHE